MLFQFFLLIRIVLGQTIILVYYMATYVLSLVHGMPQIIQTFQNRQKWAVSCMVTMVTVIIISIFSLDPNSA